MRPTLIIVFTLFTFSLAGQSYQIKGKVFDDKDIPIAVAIVKLKGDTDSTITNIDGFFEIKVSDKTGVLLVSSVNYLPKEVRFRIGKVLKIRLKKDKF